jgi:hypothetical protein
VIRALGKNVRIGPGEALTKHDFLLTLSDLLLDLVEQDAKNEHALWYSQRACSLAHDVVNMATMAGQLLWHTSVAPMRTGTPDSLFISMVAESYFVLARSACDVIEEVILELCVDPKKRGQCPKGGSFNDLLNWVIDNPTRVPDRMRFIAKHQDWFAGLRGIRDKLVHFGYDMNIYTDDVAPQFVLMSTSEITLHFLRAPREHFPGASTPVPLLPFLQRITQGVLTLSDQVAGAISEDRKHTSTKRNVLNGVYIPALHHLLSYEELKDADMTPQEKQRREFAAQYLLEAGDYLNAIKLGYPDGFWFQFAVHLAERYGKPPDYMSTPKCPPYRDGEELALWQLGFIHDGKDHTLILKDAAFLALDPAAGSKTEEERFQRLQASPGLSAAVLVANISSLSTPIPPEKMFDGLILESDPFKAADRAFMTLTAKSAPSDAV